MPQDDDSIENEDLVKKVDELEALKDSYTDPIKLANLFWNLGVLYKDLRSAFVAIEQFEEAKSIVEIMDEKVLKEAKLDFTMATLYYNLGLSAKMMHDLLLSVDHFKNAIKFSEPQHEIIVLSHFQIGYCHFKLEKWLQALDFYNGYLNGLSSLSKVDGTTLENLTMCLNHVGACAYKLKQYSLSDLFLKEAQDLSQGRFAKIDAKTKTLLASVFEEQYSSDTDLESKYGGSIGSHISDNKDVFSSDDDE